MTKKESKRRKHRSGSSSRRPSSRSKSETKFFQKTPPTIRQISLRNKLSSERSLRSTNSNTNSGTNSGTKSNTKSTKSVTKSTNSNTNSVTKSTSYTKQKSAPPTSSPSTVVQGYSVARSRKQLNEKTTKMIFEAVEPSSKRWYLPVHLARSQFNLSSAMVVVQLVTIVWFCTIFFLGNNVIMNDAIFAPSVFFIEFVTLLAVLGSGTATLLNRSLIVTSYFSGFFAYGSFLIQFYDTDTGIMAAATPQPFTISYLYICIQFFIKMALLMLSLEHATTARPEMDYMDSMIFETVPRRKKKMVKLIANLTKPTIIPDTMIGLTMIDEEGRAVNLKKGTKVTSNVAKEIGVGVNVKGHESVSVINKAVLTSVLETPGKSVVQPGIKVNQLEHSAQLKPSVVL